MVYVKLHIQGHIGMYPLKSIFISMNLDIGTRFRINGSSITSIVGDDRCYFHTDLRVRQGIQ